VLVAPATATGATWRDALGATAADVRNASAADLKRRLDAPVRPLVDAPLTAADLDAVKADAETYPDGDRPRSRAEGEAMLAQAAVASLGFRLSSEGAARFGTGRRCRSCLVATSYAQQAVGGTWQLARDDEA